MHSYERIQAAVDDNVVSNYLIVLMFDLIVFAVVHFQLAQLILFAFQRMDRNLYE